MLQEYIPGGDDVVWMFNGYFDSASDCLVGITGRKIRQTPVYTGATSLGICLRNDEVDETTRRWMKALGYRGILDIGYRYDARDDQYKVLDVNPRIGGTFRLFVARNGMDVARALYLDLTGQTVPIAEPIEGRKWLDERDVFSCLQYRRDGRLTVRQWAASLGGIRESVYFARDDIAPFVRAGSHVLREPSGSGGTAAAAPGSGPQAAATPAAGPQAAVDRHFQATAGDWRAIYAERSVYGLIHQERRTLALEWIDGLALPQGAEVLEVGCGAGLTTVALAERGLRTTAIDSAPAMIDLTLALASEHGVTGAVEASVADVHALPFADASFDLVLALGVLPWLHSPGRAIDEMARVLRPGGHLVANVDNVYRLHYLLDPRLNPVLASSRRLVGRSLRRAGVLHGGEPTPVRLERPGQFDAILDRAGLAVVRGSILGFGPFTFWRRPVLSERRGMRLHRRLQDLADRGVPGVRSTGSQYLVMARRASDPGSPR